MTQHLLMIEDDERLARMVAEYLGQSGYEVAHAPDATRGLAALQAPQARCLRWSSWT
jgi:two-component system phosphate regulon response regulator OmpR